ncbi:MAG: bifunctional rhamnulose-1-phosphate aldolase/short-chain dehydrogenase [Fidelibacterota bacterium]|nr:MAG: bifunctional rhamnulose-1-phosphate aldolase/short-chain dehydrogenase [Candidatus Neomarinimicrobiota bacterium]
MSLKYLEDKWDPKLAESLDETDTLRYRSNLLGSDLRITNFGGGNTSSKVRQTDPLTGQEVEVLWVKGSGGDLGSMGRDGFARLYMDKFLALKDRYRGSDYEDEMVGYYPLCRFGLHDRPASIDTPLHGLMPFKHIDHTHPDWGIALAATANGRKLLAEFNRQFDHHLMWLPWRRPGYELGVMLAEALKTDPQANGIILASHGLMTWGDDQYGCYRSTIEIIDALGRFVAGKIEAVGEELFGGECCQPRADRREVASQVLPFVRGLVGEAKGLIGQLVDLPEVLRFVCSRDAQRLAFQGTSCPDHFIRTKVRPFNVDWDPQKGDLDSLKESIATGLTQYRRDYADYYDSHKTADSPAMRDPNPTVVLIPGVGMLSFGKSKKEARITGEFYVNAIHVMEGATALADGTMDEGIDPDRVVNNYVALSPEEAFGIEYWALEEAKLQRQPPEKEMARRVAMVVGGGSGIGREFCTRLAHEGAHVVVADRNQEAAQETVDELKRHFGGDVALALPLDITRRGTVAKALREAAMYFGGVDDLVNTAAVFIPPDRGDGFLDATWDTVLKVNVIGNIILVEEFAVLIGEQGSEGSVLLTSSANAVVPKTGSEPYDASKAAVNHLIRELAIRYAPAIRVNGISPATVIEGSSMFPRERVMASLSKYNISFDESEEAMALIEKLAGYYAQRTLTGRPIRPRDVVEAGYFLLSPRSDRTTGHVIPVDGGLKEAFLR